MRHLDHVRAPTQTRVRSFPLHSVGILLVLAASLLSPLVCAATTPNAPSPSAAPVAMTTVTKVGTINIEQAIATSKEGRREFDALAKKFEPKQNELKGLSDEIDSLKKRLNAQQLNDESRDKLVKLIEAKQKSFDRAVKEAEEDFQNQVKEIENQVLAKMAPTIVKYAADNGYHLLFDTTQTWPRGAIVLAQPEVDITQAIVAAYDGLPAKPISAGASSTAAAAKAAVTKVRTINIEQAIFASQEGRREFDALAKKFEPKQNELKGLSDEIDSLKKQLNAQQKKLNDEARDKLVKQIEAKQKSLDRATQDAQEDFQNQQTEIASKVLQKMAPVIMKLVGDNGYGLLLDMSQAWPQGAIIWVGAEEDITKAVVAAYDGSPAEPISAAGGATAATGKLAVINLEQAISSSGEGQRTLQGVRDENDRKKVTESILGKMAPALVKFAQDQGIGILIDNSKPWPQGQILWFASQVDISQSFVEVYDPPETAHAPSNAPAAPAATLDAATISTASANASAKPPATADRGGARAQPRTTTLTPSGLSYALVIGIDHYAHLPQLHTAVNDARSVAQVLHEQYGFQTQLLLDATRSQIMTALSHYRTMLSGDANLLIYYAGHGNHDRDADKIYWMPIDAELDNSANWLLTDDVTSEIRAIPARHVLVIADSCYAGGMSRDIGNVFTPSERNSFLEKMAIGKSRTLLSSGGDEPVADAGGAGGHSRFAAALLDGLHNMQVQPFTASELWSNFVRVAVAGNSEQTPEYSFIHNSGHEKGDFVFQRQKP